MAMRNPPHPGRIVRQECIDHFGLSITAAAKLLGVSRQALNNLVNMKSGVSAETAIRLEKAFGSTADLWLRMQAAYDCRHGHQVEGIPDVQVVRGGADNVQNSYLQRTCCHFDQRPGPVKFHPWDS